jgi:hypothetical protein
MLTTTLTIVAILAVVAVAFIVGNDYATDGKLFA